MQIDIKLYYKNSFDSSVHNALTFYRHIDPDPYHKKHKTSIKWRNLNPVWNEEFLFETRPTELSRQNLTLTVWDKDYGKPNDFLGSLVLGSSSKGRRLKHWMDCIKFPDHRHEQWHSLTDTQHL